MPDTGELGPTLTNKNSPEGKAVKMVVEEPYVSITTTDKNKNPITIVVPLEQFTHLVVEE